MQTTTTTTEAPVQIVPDNSLLDRMAVFLSSQMDAKALSLFQEWKALKAKHPTTRKQLAELGRDMRNKQKQYFRAKNQANLEASLEIEARFDRTVEEILNPIKAKPQTLF